MDPKPADTDNDGLSADQEAAVAMSAATIEDRNIAERNETIVAGLVGDARSPYTSKYLDTFFDNLGLSYWSLFFLSISLFIAVEFLHLPDWLFDVAAGLLGLIVIYKFFTRYIRK